MGYNNREAGAMEEKNVILTSPTSFKNALCVLSIYAKVLAFPNFGCL
jgi:hypothetical protein